MDRPADLDTTPAAAPAMAGDPAAPRSRGLFRMYRQGLGDCLYIELARDEGAPFRMMIDCGLVLGAADQAGKIRAVVEDVVATLAGATLDLLVVTHPHWDHVSGFVLAQEAFAKLSVDTVWLAWTENPQDEMARTLKSTFALADGHLRLGMKAQAAFELHADAQKTGDLLGFLGPAPDELAAIMGTPAAPVLAQDPSGVMGIAGQGTTAAAVATAAAKGRQRHFCEPGEAPFAIAGTQARIFVLGPPRDVALLRKMDPSKSNPETYSLAALAGSPLMLGRLGDVAGAAAAGGDDDGAPFGEEAMIPLGGGGSPASGGSAPDNGGSAPDNADGGSRTARDVAFFRDRYFAEDHAWQTIDSDWLQGVTGLALLLDRAVNNSSLALAIELAPGGDVILLAADAQVGNWQSWLKLEWPLDGGAVTGPDLIARTLLYKVGHHASLNATLRKDGVEAMQRLRWSLVPVDAGEAEARGWGSNIPFPDLLAALAKPPGAVVLRSDTDVTAPPPGMVSTPRYHQVSF